MMSRVHLSPITSSTQAMGQAERLKLLEFNFLISDFIDMAGKDFNKSLAYCKLLTIISAYNTNKLSRST